jgi:hypothetical protein
MTIIAELKSGIFDARRQTASNSAARLGPHLAFPADFVGQSSRRAIGPDDRERRRPKKVGINKKILVNSLLHFASRA